MAHGFLSVFGLGDGHESHCEMSLLHPGEDVLIGTYGRKIQNFSHTVRNRYVVWLIKFIMLVYSKIIHYQ